MIYEHGHNSTAQAKRFFDVKVKRAKRRWRRWAQRFKREAIQRRRFWDMVKLVEQSYPGLQPRRVIIKAKSLDAIRAVAYWRAIELEQHRQNKTRR